MVTIKRSIFFILAGFILISAAAAQDRVMTVEESYLQQQIENMIIRETARSNSRESKLIALDNIGEAISNGNTSRDIYETLSFLGMESTRVVTRENGRVLNNFPEVRRRSAIYLGQLGTEEARVILLEMLQYEDEPMVVQEIIKSLGDIGLNENNETVAYIAWVFSKFDNLNPNNVMAVAVLDAFEKIARANNGISSPEAYQLILRIAEGRYIPPVREMARQLLADLRSTGR